MIGTFIVGESSQEIATFKIVSFLLCGRAAKQIYALVLRYLTKFGFGL